MMMSEDISEKFKIIEQISKGQFHFYQETESCKMLACRSQWTIEQKNIYGEFVRKNYESFKSYLEEDKWQLFKLMSEYVPTRTPNQCRIFHLQMLKENKTIQSILTFLEIEIKSQIEKNKLSSTEDVYPEGNNTTWNIQNPRMNSRPNWEPAFQ